MQVVYIFFGILLFIIVVIAASTIKIIKQSTVGLVMRLGRYHRTATTGINIIAPFIDTMYTIVDLRERVMDFDPQPVITKDNVTMQIDTVVYFKVTDPVSYIFEIANPMSAIENLAATTLRNIIGDLDLDETLTSRDIINTNLRSILDEATDPWGIKVNRVELKNIIPPKDIRDAMEKQMRAERQRRESILRAEGSKAAAVLEAEGNKASIILNAEANKESVVRAAEADRASRILRAEGEAEAIRAVESAKADGIKFVFNAIKESDPTDQVLAIRSMEAFEKMAEGKSTKLIIPSEAVALLGSFKGLKEVMLDANETK